MRSIRIRSLGILLFLALAGGCTTHYELSARNDTVGVLHKVRAKFENNKEFEWGVMNPGVKATALFMPGPFGDSAVVEWTDAAGSNRSARVDLPHGLTVNVLRFVIHEDGTVAVEGQHR